MMRTLPPYNSKNDEGDTVDYDNSNNNKRKLEITTDSRSGSNASVSTCVKEKEPGSLSLVVSTSQSKYNNSGVDNENVEYKKIDKNDGKSLSGFSSNRKKKSLTFQL